MEQVKNPGKPVVIVNFGDYSHSPFIAARQLSGALRANGFETRILTVPLERKGFALREWNYRELDVGDKTLDHVVNMCRDALFVGITTHTAEAHIVKKLYPRLKASVGAPVVAGGAHPTVEPRHASGFADYVCVGEGEIGVVQLARRLMALANPRGEEACSQEGIQNFFSSARIKADPDFLSHSRGVEITSMDTNFAPDYTFESEYRITAEGAGRITKENASQYTWIYGTLFSRGCAYNCTYCSSEILAERSGYRRRIKAKPLDTFIAELVNVKRNSPWVREISLVDPNILSNKKETLLKLAREYKEKVGLPLLMCGITWNQLDETVLRAFLDAGLHYTVVGIETGAMDTREVMGRKHEKLDTIKKGDELLYRLKREYKFTVKYDFILDIPWATLKDNLESLKFTASLKAYDDLELFSLALFPGTRLFDRAVKEGLIQKDQLDDVFRKTQRGFAPTFENYLFTKLKEKKIASGPMLSLLANRPVAGAANWLLRRYHGAGAYSFYES